MIAGVVAIGVVSVAAIGGLLSLAWALVSRLEQCAELRERLATAHANVRASDQDLDRMELAYRGEVEKTAALVNAMARKRAAGGDETPADPFVLFDRVLGEWRARTSQAADGIRANRKLRLAADASAVAGNVGDGPDEATAVPRSGDATDASVSDTSPQSPRAIARKNPRS